MNNLTKIFCSFLLSMSIQAQTYQAPKFNFKSKETPQAEVKQAQDEWRSDYRIENQVQPQRELASEKEEWVDYSDRGTSRDPSSLPTPKASGQNPNIRPWLWSGE